MAGLWIAYLLWLYVEVPGGVGVVVQLASGSDDETGVLVGGVGVGVGHGCGGGEERGEGPGVAAGDVLGDEQLTGPLHPAALDVLDR